MYSVLVIGCFCLYSSLLWVCFFYLVVVYNPPSDRPTTTTKTYTVITEFQTWHKTKPLWSDTKGPYGHFQDTDGHEVRVYGNFVLIEEAPPSALLNKETK